MRGARDNQLIGYGLVVGLQGTGDTLRNAPFTEQAIQSMLDRMGINVRGSTLRNRNVAAVIVTADLPAGMDAGSRLDVTVSALGDATSLMGGTLLLTQLSATDGQRLRERARRGFGHRLRRRRPGAKPCRRACRPPAGFPTARSSSGPCRRRPTNCGMILELRNPDYTTAVRIVDAINAYSQQPLPPPLGVRVRRPDRRIVPSAGDQRHALHGGDRRIAGRAGHRRRASSSMRAPAPW